MATKKKAVKKVAKKQATPPQQPLRRFTGLTEKDLPPNVRLARTDAEGRVQVNGLPADTQVAIVAATNFKTEISSSRPALIGQGLQRSTLTFATREPQPREG